MSRRKENKVSMIKESIDFKSNKIEQQNIVLELIKKDNIALLQSFIFYGKSFLSKKLINI